MCISFVYLSWGKVYLKPLAVFIGLPCYIIKNDLSKLSLDYVLGSTKCPVNSDFSSASCLEVCMVGQGFAVYPWYLEQTDFGLGAVLLSAFQVVAQVLDGFEG